MNDEPVQESPSNTAAANHREVMRLKTIMREHGLLDETLQPQT